MRKLTLLCFTLFLSACDGPPAGNCSTSNCLGCCDSSGQCVPGTASNACGSGGNVCSTCLVCQLGQCVTGNGGGTGTGGGTGGGGAVGGGGGTCRPTTCVALGFNCGEADDGCGGQLSCGRCEVMGESCGAGGATNVCGPGVCTPGTCTTLGKNCGQVGDGCGTLLMCGVCSGTQTCGGGGTANVCATPACTPRTCAQLQKNCGMVSDGCTSQLDCGTCSGTESCGGGGTPNVCGTGACTPTTCAALSKNCGLVSDGCTSQLDCGTCSGVQTCAGGGTPNVCGAACPSSCPAGFSCAPASGVCSGGMLTSMVLDVPVPPLHTTSGSVTVNNAPPQLDPVGGFCTGTTATLSFVHATDTRFNAITSVSCTGFAWTVSLYPGTYRVTLGADADATTLPQWSTVVDPAFGVSAPRTGVVFNVPVPPTHTVSGTVTVNNAAPQLDPVGGFCTGTTATLTFVHSTDTRFNAITSVSCTGFAWTVSLYPGTYQVTLGADADATTLPEWNSVVDMAFVISAPRTGVVFNVPVPPIHTVSGTVTVNNAPPQLDPVGGFCTGTTATLSFVHSTDTRFNAITPVSCTGFAWTVSLYPGTYRVTLGADADATTLPAWSTVVDMAFVISAPRSGVVFNVPVPPIHTVSGTVAVNNAAPQLDPVGGFCTGTTATLTFVHSTDPRFNAITSVSCTGFTWTVPLYPGTYQVTLGADADATTLPEWNSVVDMAFVISAPRSGVVFNVPVPPIHTVSGTVTVNNAPPQLDPVGGFCTGTTATLTFVHSTDTRFNASTSISCTGFAWTVSLYPGTYRVTIGADADATTLPSWSTVVDMAFVISAPRSGVVFDVPVPPTRTVSGTITVNGAAPQLEPVGGFCTGTTATLTFTHLTDARFNASTSVSCTGFTFTVSLFPGTYRVTIGADADATTLPEWSTVVVDRLLIP